MSGNESGRRKSTMKTKLLYALLFGLVLLAIAQVVSAEDVLLEGTINGFSIWDGDEFIGSAPLMIDEESLEDLFFVQYRGQSEVFAARLHLNENEIGNHLTIPFYPRNDEMDNFPFALEFALYLFYEVENNLPNHVESTVEFLRLNYNIDEYDMRYAKFSRDKKKLILPFLSKELNQEGMVILLKIGEDEKPTKLEIKKLSRSKFLFTAPETDILISPDSRWLFLSSYNPGGHTIHMTFFDLTDEYEPQVIPSSLTGLNSSCAWDYYDPIVYCDGRDEVEQYQFENGRWFKYIPVSFAEGFYAGNPIFPMRDYVMVTVNDKFVVYNKSTLETVLEIEGYWIIFAAENGERLITANSDFDMIHLYDFSDGRELHLPAEDFGQAYGSVLSSPKTFFPSERSRMRNSEVLFDYLYDYSREIFRFQEFAAEIMGVDDDYVDRSIQKSCRFHLVNEFLVFECPVRSYESFFFSHNGDMYHYTNNSMLNESDLSDDDAFTPLLKKVFEEREIKSAYLLDIFMIPKTKGELKNEH